MGSQIKYLKERESNMELLRMVSMLCIIIYHIFIFGLEPAFPEQHLYKALQIPFHIGVPCFVLISGYFGIRFSFKGLFRLMGMAYTYAILVELCGVVFLQYPISNLTNGIFVIGHNRHWFLTTYLWLYLLSPMINKYIAGIKKTERVYLLLVLMFVNFYAGHIMQHEPSLSEGKNILNFMLLYLIGNTIHAYHGYINRIRKAVFIGLFLLIAVFTTFIGITHPDYQLPLVGNVWYRFFGYDSVGMYINAILVFLFFSQLQFKSRTVNYLSGGVFSMYLLSVSFIWDFLQESSVRIGMKFGNPLFVIAICILLAISFMIFCITVDKLMLPLWNKFKQYGSVLDGKLQIK